MLEEFNSLEYVSLPEVIVSKCSLFCSSLDTRATIQRALSR